MPRNSNPQITLKPQDLVVIVKVALRNGRFTYADLSDELFMSASEIHATVARARLSRLMVSREDRTMEVVRTALREFLVHGARYAFPPILGPLVRGIPTAYAAPSLREQLSLSGDPVPVWPYSKGTDRGMALQPLYPSVPRAAELDKQLYEVLAMLDAVRIGAARERELAIDILNRVLA